MVVVTTTVATRSVKCEWMGNSRVCILIPSLSSATPVFLVATHCLIDEIGFFPRVLPALMHKS